MKSLKEPAYYEQLEAELTRRFYAPDPGRSVPFDPASVIIPEASSAPAGKPKPRLARAEHGTNSCYTGGCRCVACCQAHAKSSKLYRTTKAGA